MPIPLCWRRIRAWIRPERRLQVHRRQRAAMESHRSRTACRSSSCAAAPPRRGPVGGTAGAEIRRRRGAAQCPSESRCARTGSGRARGAVVGAGDHRTPWSMDRCTRRPRRPVVAVADHGGPTTGSPFAPRHLLGPGSSRSRERRAESMRASPGRSPQAVGPSSGSIRSRPGSKTRSSGRHSRAVVRARS